MDPNYRNFLVLRNYVSIGCSYMTTVVQEQLQKNKNHTLNNEIFDYEGFNYTIQGKTELHDLVDNFQNLQFILDKYTEENPQFLQQLLIINEDNKTPLHLAVDNTNYRAVNIILDKLSIMNVSNSESLKDLFESLLDFVSFNKYLNSCFFQTEQMHQIQNMKVKKGANPFELVFDIQDSFIDSEF